MEVIVFTSDRYVSLLDKFAYLFNKHSIRNLERESEEVFFRLVPRHPHSGTIYDPVQVFGEFDF